MRAQPLHFPNIVSTGADSFVGGYSEPTSNNFKLNNLLNQLELNLTEIETYAFDTEKQVVNDEQLEKINNYTFQSLDNTLRSLKSIIEDSTKVRNDNVQILDVPNHVAFASLLDEYIGYGITLIKESFFNKHSMTQLIGAFSHLHYVYLTIMLNPNVEVTEDQFREVWKRMYMATSKIPLLIAEIDFASFSKTIEDFVSMFNNHYKNQDSGNPLPDFVVDITESSEALKNDLFRFNRAEPNEQMIKNTLIDLNCFQEEAKVVLAKTSGTPKFVFIGPHTMAQLTSLSTILDMCLSSLLFAKLTQRLDDFIRSGRFSIVKSAFQNPFVNYVGFNNSFDYMATEILILMSTLDNKYKEANFTAAYKAAKALHEHLLICDDFLTNLKGQKCFRKISSLPLIDDPIGDILFQSIIQKLNNIDNIAQSGEQQEQAISPKVIIRIKQYFNNFQASFQIPPTTIEAFVQRFNTFSLFEESLTRYLQGTNQVNDLAPLFDRYRNYVVANFIILKVDESSKLILSHLIEIRHKYYSPVISYQEMKRYTNLNAAVEVLGSFVDSIIYSDMYIKKADIFIQFFSLFIRVFHLVLSLNKSVEYEPVITFALTSFPQLPMMNKAMKKAEHLAIVRSSISKTQAHSYIISDALSNFRDQLDDKNLPLSEIYKRTETAFTQINQIVRGVENLRLACKFTSYYESFLSRYYQAPPKPIQYRSDSSISQNLVDIFPKFSIILLSIVKSNFFKQYLTSAFFIHWLSFIRSVILNEEVDRKAAFVKLVESIPFFDFAESLNHVIYVMKLIRAMIYVHQAANPHLFQQMCVLISMFQKIEKAFQRVLITSQFENQFDSLNDEFIKTVKSISPALYEKIIRVWPFICNFFMQVTNLGNFVRLIKYLRNDLQIEAVEITFFACFFLNFAGSLNRCLKRVIENDNLISFNIEKTKRFNTFFDAVTKKYRTFIDEKTSHYITSTLSELQKLQSVWTLQVIPGMSLQAKTWLLQLMNIVSLSLQPECPVIIRKLMELDKLLKFFEKELSIEKLYVVSFDFKDRLSDIHFIPSVNVNSYNITYKRLGIYIDSVINILLVNSHFSLLNMYVSKFLGDQPHIIYSLNLISPELLIQPRATEKMENVYDMQIDIEEIDKISENIDKSFEIEKDDDVKTKLVILKTTLGDAKSYFKKHIDQVASDAPNLKSKSDLLSISSDIQEENNILLKELMSKNEEYLSMAQEWNKSHEDITKQLTALTDKVQAMKEEQKHKENAVNRVLFEKSKLMEQKSELLQQIRIAEENIKSNEIPIQEHIKEDTFEDSCNEKNYDKPHLQSEYAYKAIDQSIHKTMELKDKIEKGTKENKYLDEITSLEEEISQLKQALEDGSNDNLIEYDKNNEERIEGELLNNIDSIRHANENLSPSQLKEKMITLNNNINSLNTYLIVHKQNCEIIKHAQNLEDEKMRQYRSALFLLLGNDEE